MALSRLSSWFADWKLERRIAALDPGNRARILAASSLEDVWFQGEGARLYRKGSGADAEPVEILGECSPREAEDAIIRHWFKAGGE